MTLTKSDLEKIGGLLNKQKEEIISVVDGKLEKQKNEILFSVDTSVDGKLEKQKNEILFSVDTSVDEKLKKQRKEINADMADLIHEQNDYLDTQFKEIGHRFDTMERRFEKHEDRLINSFNSNL